MIVEGNSDYIYDIQSLDFKKGNNRFIIKKISNNTMYIRYVINKEDKSDSYSIDIDKNDGYIYDIFDELYNSIREYRKFNLSDKRECDSKYETRKHYDSLTQNPFALIKGEKITYRSDMSGYSYPSKFIMYPTDNGYRLVFERAKNYFDDEPEYYDFNTKIDLVSGKYSPLSQNFFAFFDAVYSYTNNKLDDYDDEYYQISLEEYINQKSLKK